MQPLQDTTRVRPRRWFPYGASLLAVLAAGVLWNALQARTAATRFHAGLIFAEGACEVSPGIAEDLGGALDASDCAAIERIARSEVGRAFAGLRIDVTADPWAFWTVHVQAFVPARSRTIGAAGASLAFGPLGGRGTVGLSMLAAHARRHAPAGTSRAALVTAIGRGVGRSVVHEFAHQIAGGVIDGSDASTYEYGSADRPGQYYGVLHWGGAFARLRARLGD